MSNNTERYTKIERLDELRDCLLTAPATGYSIPQLMGKLEMTRATIYRYIKQYGDDLQIERIGRGRYRISPDSVRIPMQFTPDECMALLLASRMLARTTDRKYPAASSALQEISAGLKTISEPFSKQMDVASAAFLHNKYPVDKQTAYLQQLTQAFTNGTQVKLKYKDRFGDVQIITFEPYFFEPYPEKRTIYSIGRRLANGTKEEKVLTLRLDRIIGLIPTTESYIIPNSFNPIQRLKNAWTIWGGDEGDALDIVILHIASALQSQLAHTIWHHSQQVTNNPDGSILMQFSVSTWREMVKWILSWGAGITVLEPEPLRIHIETEIGMMLVQYQS